MKKFRLLALFCFAARVLFAQPQPCGPNPEMTSFCDEACIICDINGFTGINDDPQQGQAPPGFCTGTVHHMQWIGFIAGSTSWTLRVRVFNCQQNGGLEVGIYKSLDCANFQLVSNCDGDIAPDQSSIFNTTVSLTIGQYYYFVMDGNMDDVCNYTIEVISGTTLVPPLPSSGQINGGFTVCPGRSEQYNAVTPAGAAWFSWTLDGVFHDDGPASNTSVNWQTPGEHTLCVTASNVCDTAPPSCRTINVVPIPPTEISATICAGECWQGADTVLCDAGFREIHLKTPGDCDSTVLVRLEVLPLSESTLALRICPGDTARAGGEAFTTAGLFSVTVPAANGCDSTISAQIEILPTSTSSVNLEICAGDTAFAGGQALVSAGVFPLTVTAANGCDSTIFAIVKVKPVASGSVNLVICAGDSVLVGGQKFFSAGAFQVVTSAENGCDSTILAQIEVLPTAASSLDLMICEGDTVRVGGKPFFSPGNFRVTVPAANGCDSTIRLALQVIACEIRGKLLAESVNCFGQPTGALRFSINHATPPLHYVWERVGPGAPSGGGDILALNSEIHIPDLPEGTYFVTVTDDFGNDAILFGYVTEPTLLSGVLQSTDFQSFGISCFGAADGWLRLVPAGGKTPYRYLWSTGDTTDFLQNLNPGAFSVTLTDANHCTQTFEKTLAGPPELRFEIAFEHPDCSAENSGRAWVTLAGGGVPDYRFDLSGRGFGPDSSFHLLTGGNYQLTLRDANGCTRTAPFHLEPVFIPDLELGPDKTIELGESIPLLWPQNVPLDTFIWSPRPGLSCYDCPHPDASPFLETTFWLTVQAPGLGCTDTDSLTVRVMLDRDVYIPSAFSPADENGQNDFFTVFGGPEVLKIKHLEIWSRWGELIFRKTDFAPNAEPEGWDGKFRGRVMAPGVFVWLAEVAFVDGVTIAYRGNVTVLR